MTELLEHVFSEISKLPDRQQDELARWILEELESEQRWQQAFDASADVLASMADAALAEHKAGNTEPLDPDTL